MEFFGILITASSLTSFSVGAYTDNIFNGFAIYSPLAVMSWAITEWFNDRKIKKQLLEEK